MSKKKQNNAINLWDDHCESIQEKYLVLAGVNKKTSRQLFLSTFDDCDEWSISVVPTVMSYNRAVYMIEKAKQDIEAKTKKIDYPPFEIIRLEDCPLTSSERRVIL